MATLGNWSESTSKMVGSITHALRHLQIDAFLSGRKQAKGGGQVKLAQHQLAVVDTLEAGLSGNGEILAFNIIGIENAGFHFPNRAPPAAAKIKG